MTEQLANLAQTTLAAPIGAPAAGTSEVIQVVSATQFPTGPVFRLNLGGGELGKVTAVSGTEWTVERGAEGTIPVVHPAAQVVVCVETKASLEALLSAAQSAAEAFATTGLATKASLASPALTGTPTVPTAPAGTSTTQAASAAFVANAVAEAVSGLTAHTNVEYATAAALPTNTYLSGVITGTALAALSVDGETVEVAQRILVKNEAAEAHNGLYVVTHAGGVAEAFVLTRAADMSSSSSEVEKAYTFVEAGKTLKNSGWFVATPGPFTIGTTAIPWARLPGTGDLVAGEGIQITGNQVAVSDSVVSNRDFRSFGAKVDARMLNGITVAGTAVTSAESLFEASDVGRTFCAFLANGSGIAGQSKVVKYNSPTSITLETAIITPPEVKHIQEAVLSSGGNNTETTFTVKLTGVTAGHSLLLRAIVGAVSGNNAPILSVSDNVGGEWVKVVGHPLTSFSILTEDDLWQCLSSPGGEVTVTVTSTVAADKEGVSLLLQEWSGIGMPDQTTYNSGTGTLAEIKVTTQVAGEVVLMSMASTAAPSASPTSPWTADVGGEWFKKAQAPVAYQVYEEAHEISAKWTITSAFWACIGVSFRPTGPVTAGIIGTDDTAAWQAFATWAAENPSEGGKVRYNEPTGISLIAGPQVTGEVEGTNPLAEKAKYRYSGQILLPAVSLHEPETHSMRLIEIEGATPFAGILEHGTSLDYPESPSFIIFSTATSGKCIDVVPDPYGFGYGPGAFSFVQFNLRRAAIRTVYNASGKGPSAVSTLAAASATFDETSIDAANMPEMTDSPPSPGPLVNSGVGLELPGDQNWSVVDWKRSQVIGYPKGIVYSEHSTLDGMIANCGADLCPGSLATTPQRKVGAHSATLKRVLLQASRVHVEPLTGRGIGNMSHDGRLEIEGPSDCHINDPEGYLKGKVDVGGAQAFRHTWVRACGPYYFINIAGYPQPQAVGRVPVIDSLTSRATGPDVNGNPTPLGLADTTYHSWAQKKIWVDANGFYIGEHGFAYAYVQNTPPYTSRKITATIKTSPTTHRSFMGLQFRSAKPNSEPLAIILDGTANQRVALYTGELATLVTSASLAIAENTSYLTEVYVQSSSLPGAGVLLTVYVNGTRVLTYTLTKAQAETYLATGSDGIVGSLGATADDGGSRVSKFSIEPLTDLPYVASSTATLVGGTVAVANTAVTANTKVRVWNDSPSGTVGALSVAIEAGTGFTIKSSSGSDTSTVYYEIVSY